MVSDPLTHQANVFVATNIEATAIAAQVADKTR